MSSDEILKVKKSKKEKKCYEHTEAQVPEEYDFTVIEKSEKKKKKKEKDREAEIEETTLEEPPSKKHKKHKKDKSTSHIEESVIEEEMQEDKPEKKKKKKKEKKEKKETIEDEECVDLTTPVKEKKRELTSEVPVSTPTATANADQNGEWCVDSGGARYWRRLDVDKYQKVVSGTKYADNSHYAKGGDSWGDDAADRLGKVRGKGFKKEMQKLKRASWKGTGSIDTGVNSVQFSDWED
jgi:outer membrane biosynthesis protein TonB